MVLGKFQTAVLGLLCTLAVPAFAGEYAVLTNGLRLRIDRHETVGDVVRLYSGNGTTELPASTVVYFEQDGSIPPPPVERVKPEPLPDTHDLIRAAAIQAGLPAEFVESVAKIESRMNADAVSPKGAIGVMQLMPQTARELSADPHDNVQNIYAGARLLRELLLKYDGNVVKALSAYNAGSGAVDRYRGMPPYAETQNYVNRVIRQYLHERGR